MSTNTKLAEALRRCEQVIREACEEDPGKWDWAAINADEGAQAREAITAHDAEQAQEAQQPAGQEQDERAAFEAWAATYSTFPLERDDDDGLGTTGYTQMEQTMLWDAWQARAALAQRREPLTNDQFHALKMTVADALIGYRGRPDGPPPHALLAARWLTDADADASRPALEIENERLRRNIKNAINNIVCIGGPLNDNKLGYSKQQMVTFWRIKEELEA